MYTCRLCGRDFASKQCLDVHTTKKNCKDLSAKCRLCGKGFTTSTSMYRHMRTTCPVKRTDDEQKEDILDKLVKTQENSMKQIKFLEEQNKKLENEVKLLKTNSITNKVINRNNGPVVNSANNVMINNITLVGYGKEDISKLSKSELLRVLQNGFNSTIKLTEAVHFNPKYPEYHNIYISNMKDKYAMMFDGKKWTLTTKEELIDQIYEDKKNYIEENLDEFIGSLTLSKRQALKRWLDTDDEDPKIKEIKENIKLLLYNSRKLIVDEQTDIKPKSKKVL